MDRSVSLVRCDDYERLRSEAAVRQAVALLGGMGRFVRPGQRVLVKPNMVLPSEPSRAVVTHPMVLRAVVKLAREAGGTVLIADNPCVVPVSERGWRAAYERCGWDEVAAETGAELNLGITAEQRPHPAGTLVKAVDVSSFLTEADVVISVPKLKTHGLLRMTGAVKNLFGVVPGAAKFGYHAKLQTMERFAEMLVDLAEFVRPALTVMDAVVGMEGKGPSAGRPVQIGAILAGTDPVAVDVAAIHLVGHDPMSVPTVAEAARRNLTTGRIADLVLVGGDPEVRRLTTFDMPPGGRSVMDYVPVPLRRLGAAYLVATPVVTEHCVGCRQCIESCPVQAIDDLRGQARIDRARCIRCYCCHELCAERAIDLREPLVARVLAGMLRQGS